MIVINPICDDRVEVSVDSRPTRMMDYNQLVDFINHELKLDLKFTSEEDIKIEKIENYLEEQMKAIVCQVRSIVDSKES